jgi:uncharacterized membrane protein
MDFENFLLHNLVSGFFYMVGPLCARLVCWGCEKKMTIKQIRSFVWINYVIVWLLLGILYEEMGYRVGTALVWPILAQWMLKKKCLKKE